MCATDTRRHSSPPVCKKPAGAALTERVSSRSPQPRAFTVVSSRGCPFRCDFCSERFLLGDNYRCRPVPEVVEEIKHCRSSNILFGDSNFGGKRSHAMELMEALIPLKVRWSALWSSYLCNDVEFLDLAKRSGLLHVNIGIESLNPETLEGMNKRFNKAERYAEMLG